MLRYSVQLNVYSVQYVGAQLRFVPARCIHECGDGGRALSEKPVSRTLLVARRNKNQVWQEVAKNVFSINIRILHYNQFFTTVFISNHGHVNRIICLWH